MNKLLGFLLLLLVFTSCSITKEKSLLLDHKTQLERAVLEQEDPRKQLKLLSKSLVSMMDQGLNYTNPKKGAQYITKYKDQNKESILSILKNLESWTSEMEPIDQIGLGISLLSDADVKQLMELIPKFEKKYKQVQFYNKLSSKLKNFIFGSTRKI